MGHGTWHGNDLHHLRLSQQINGLHAVGGWSALDATLQHASDSVAWTPTHPSVGPLYSPVKEVSL